jgi:hypothetical protein
MALWKRRDWSEAACDAGDPLGGVQRGRARRVRAIPVSGPVSMMMRQSHAARGEVFIDYAGDSASVVIDRLSGDGAPRRSLSLLHMAPPTSPTRKRPGRRCSSITCQNGAIIDAANSPMTPICPGPWPSIGVTGMDPSQGSC